MMRSKRKIILGITGGTGCGKTTVSEMFRKNNIDVIDGDLVAREIVGVGMPALDEISEAFGKEYINGDGTLDRKNLGRLVFNNQTKLIKLNQITHKYITINIKEKISRSKSDIVCVDAAALIESGFLNECDYLLVVLADRKLRRERICLRDSMSVDDANARISAQKQDEFYLEKADFVVYNNGDIFKLEAEVINIINKLRSLA